MADTATRRSARERLVDLGWEVAKNCSSALLIYLGGVIGGFIKLSPRLVAISFLLALLGVVVIVLLGVGVEAGAVAPAEPPPPIRPPIRDNNAGDDNDR